MEKKDLVGQIKVNLYASGSPEVIITGSIRAGVVTRIQPLVRRAYRKHKQVLFREAQVDMSDKGLKLEDIPDIVNIEAKPDLPVPIKLPADLSAPPSVDQFIPDGSAEDPFNEIEEETEQANNPEESEEDNGTNEGTETVRRDDEEPGSEGSPSWQVG